MACQSNEGSLIQEGDQVVVRIDKNMKVVPVRRNCKLWIERSKFFLDSAIGFPYGTSFKVVNQKLEKVKLVGGDLELDDEDGTRDNRNLTDSTDNQKLSFDEIRSMRKDGVHGEEIVEQLIQNSATFNQKNDFAKQKYIKKKKKKYVAVITILKPTARLLLEMYYNKGPMRICNLRLDSLGQVLTHGNIRSGNKMLVVETCVGLVVGAIMERMGRHGTVIQLFSGSAPVQQAVESFDFPEEQKKNLHSYPLSKVKDLGQETVQQQENSHPKDGENLQEDNREVECETMAEAEEEEVEETGEDSAGDNQTDDAAKSDPEGVSASKGVKRKHETKVLPNKEEKVKKWQERQMYYQNVKEMIEKKDSDGLIVVTKFHPTPIVTSLIDYVAPSRPIAVFCQHKEPLMDCYLHLRERGGVVLLKLTETWLRGYQVLSNRTHPKISMSGTGGYLLTGTTVQE